ncbi:MAG: hypothetical protein ACFB0C_22020 [Leptolyngbyaceae cyanobacterium]
MLQKIYWLAHIESSQIHLKQEVRSLFCKQEFPHSTFLSPAFFMSDGGLVSGAYSWTLVINNRSIFYGAGSVTTPIDEISEQIRRLLILKLNLFFGTSPKEVESHCNTLHSVVHDLIPGKILPEVFGNNSRSLHKEIESLSCWFEKILSMPRKQYLAVCQVLSAYERALHIISSDPALVVQKTFQHLSQSHHENLITLLNSMRCSKASRFR